MYDGLLPSGLLAELGRSLGTQAGGPSWSSYQIEEAYELPDDEELKQLRGCT